MRTRRGGGPRRLSAVNAHRSGGGGLPRRRPRRHREITVTGRLAAKTVMVLAGAALAALGVTAAAGRVTPREVLWAVIAFTAGAVAAAWLYGNRGRKP